MTETAATDDPLARLAAAVGRPDEQAREATRTAAPVPEAPLDELASWLAAVQGGAPQRPSRPRLLVLADPAVAGEVPARTAEVAADVAVEPRLINPERTTTAVDGILAGAAVADAEVDAGVDLLLVALPDPALQVPAAALVGLLTGSDASAVTATGQDDAAWIAACAATRDLMRRARPQLGDQPALLAAVGGPELAVATGLLLGAAARRTPVLLDGPVCTAAALAAARIAFRAPNWWRAAHLSPDPAHRLALARLSLEPLLEVGLRGDDGIGALLAVPLLRAAALAHSAADR